MHNPKVSIIIPVYNGADFMAAAIDSALAQTYDNFEVVVVNDGSTDAGATERIAQSYGDRIRYFAKPNGGVATALNYAIEQATGDYISWLSHDDLYLPNKIAAQMAVLQNCGYLNPVIYSDFGTFTFDAMDYTPVRLQTMASENFRYWITVKNALHGCTLLIPRQAFDDVGLFNDQLRTTQDYDMWFRMATRYRFIHLPEILVKGRSHPNQGSHTMADTARRECNTMMIDFINKLSVAEIEAGANKPAAAAYQDIAASMYLRQFNEAGKHAENLASKLQHNPVLKTKLALRRLLFTGYHLLRQLSTRLPASLKYRLKKLLRAPAVVTAVPADAGASIIVNAAYLPEKFTEIYEKNIFGGRHSRSGEGSDMVQTQTIRDALSTIVEQYGVDTFLDAPCGDWYWMQHTKLGTAHYIGVDIVQPLIDKNQQQFGDDTHRFACVNLATDSLPAADMIFSRDCLVHLTLADARAIIANFKQSGAQYLLTTTFPARTNNPDLIPPTDFWRPLNMCLPPFNFPAPILLVNEGCTEDHGNYADKSLGLWRLADISA